MRQTLRRGTLAVAAAPACLLALMPATTASAHSLTSSTINLRVEATAVDAAVSVPLATLEAATGIDVGSATSSETAAEIVDYLDEHLSVTGADGSSWTETWSEGTAQTVEGVQSFTVDVSLAPGAADPGDFTLRYDGIIEADPAHEAVVVLTDAAGDISTPGVLDASDSTLSIGEVPDAGLVDMVGYGLHHVLQGADHLLFLLTLLLVAPLVPVSGRWRSRDRALPTAVRVLGVATAFTLGHSLTLIASALGWISMPTVLVEVLVAGSVAVAAVHALRPLVPRGEEYIAAGFGLVHGLAFAGILADLGVSGSTSLLTLLAFNIGVELAQLVAIGLVFTSLFVASRTRFYPALRMALGALALVAALGWIVERIGLTGNPLAGAEAALIDHPWTAVAGLALAAAACRVVDRARSGTVELSAATRPCGGPGAGG